MPVLPVAVLVLQDTLFVLCCLEWEWPLQTKDKYNISPYPQLFVFLLRNVRFSFLMKDPDKTINRTSQARPQKSNEIRAERLQGGRKKKEKSFILPLVSLSILFRCLHIATTYHREVFSQVSRTQSHLLVIRLVYVGSSFCFVKKSLSHLYVSEA